MIISTTLAGPGAESSIGDALRSALPLVDVIMLIAGSDSTATIEAALQALNGSGVPVFVEHLEWPDDYGKARNFALERAEAMGATWALTVDCDERLLIEPAALKELDEPGVNVWCVPDRDLLYQKPRFIRCGVGARWKRRCHERLVVEGVQAHLAGQFWELSKSAASEAKRWQRGLDWCPGMLAEEEDPSLRRHYAECLLSAGRDPEAREQFVQVAQSPETPLWERTWCEYRLSEFDAVAGDYVSARARAASALARDPGFIQELGWVLAHCAAKLKEFQTAALWAAYALQAPIDYSRGGHRGSTWRQGCTELLQRIQEAAERQMPREMTAAHFAARHEFSADYAKLARALVETLSFASHMDLGAGNGLLVEAMTNRQVISCGLEQSADAEAETTESIAGRIRYGTGIDEWHRQPDGETFDLVSCVEVLEHVAPELADVAVRAICSRSSRYVYFSAAQPGQGGIGHVNEQLPHYWIQKFQAQGFRMDEGATEELRRRLTDCARCWWLKRNALIFTRSGAES